ncbi:hypothetical protein V1289_005588 [Bradyrhizobium sp. AZCC 2289]
MRRYGLLRGACHRAALCADPLARNDDVEASGATKLPDGQISKSLSSPSRKNISLPPSGKSVVSLRASHPKEGRVAIVRYVAVGCGGRGCHEDERGGSGRRSRVVLAPDAGAKFARAQASRGRWWQKSTPHRGATVMNWTSDRPGSRLASATASGGFGLEPVRSPVLWLGRRSVADRAQRRRSISSMRTDWHPTFGAARS